MRRIEITSIQIFRQSHARNMFFSIYVLNDKIRNKHYLSKPPSRKDLSQARKMFFSIYVLNDKIRNKHYLSQPPSRKDFILIYTSTHFFPRLLLLNMSKTKQNNTVVHKRELHKWSKSCIQPPH